MNDKLDTFRVWLFAWFITKSAMRLLYISIFKSRDIEAFSDQFLDLYSVLLDYSEQSVSHERIDYPQAIGDGPHNKINRALAKLYGSKFASVSYGGSSGAALLILIAVLPKLSPKREIVLYDDAAHQSFMAGVIFSRTKCVPLRRAINKKYGVAEPIRFKDIKEKVEQYGADTIRAVWLVAPSYSGFRSVEDETLTYEYLQSQSVILVIDGAWSGASFADNAKTVPPISSISDIAIISCHKRGVTVSSQGAITTDICDIARLIEKANELGFRSSSISFVETMVSRHRLEKIEQGCWQGRFKQAESAAKEIRARIKEIHADLEVITPEMIGFDYGDPSHILISTRNLDIDARQWAQCLSEDFYIDIEKSTQNSILLLCGAPINQLTINQTLNALRVSLQQKLKMET